MRWDNLFDDLESQLERETSADEAEERAEDERLRIGRLSLRDRLVNLTSDAATVRERPLTVHLSNGDAWGVLPSTFGRDWFAGVIDGMSERSQCIVPLAAISQVSLSRSDLTSSLAGAHGQTSRGSLAARLSLPFALRDLCRKRSNVELTSTSGKLFGTIDRVGRDHLDLAIHERGDVRRESLVSGYRIVVLNQLVFIRF